MFQSYVKQEAEATEHLLGFVPMKLEELKKEMEDSVKDIPSVKYEEWDCELEKNVVRTWYPFVDTSIVEEMLNLFYSTIVVRIYTFAENGLRILSEISTKPKQPKGLSGQKQQSDIDLYYQEIEKKQGISLPPIETLWPNKDSFHALRKRITHHGQNQLTKQESDSLSTELETILKMLLFIEEQIRVKNPEFDPK